MSYVHSLVFVAAVTTTLGSPYAASDAEQSAHPFMEEKGPTLAPFAHVEFCMKFPGECSKKAGPSVVALTPGNEESLRKVNTSVNEDIIPQEDPPQQETWTLNPSAGDCNDYAVTKRSDLIKDGLPEAAVRLAVAKTPDGEGHAVVVVRTTAGDMVLDNRTPDIKRWDQTDLTWLKIERSSDPKMWDTVSRAGT